MMADRERWGYVDLNLVLYGAAESVVAEITERSKSEDIYVTIGNDDTYWTAHLDKVEFTPD